MAPTRLQPTDDDLAVFASYEARGRPLHPEIKDRVVIERAVIRHAASAILAAGYRLRLHDGETWATALTDSLDTVMREVWACDMERLYVWVPSSDPGNDGKYIGSLMLVYGNDGWDVIADHSVALEDVLQTTYAYAESLS